VSAELVIILAAALAGVAGALPGGFLVLRRMAMMGDAISHSVLLGIVVAFVLTGGAASLAMVLGAAAVGLLTVALVEVVRRSGLVREDAAIGLVFPALFAVGVIAVSRFPNEVHLDVEHVLYGEIAYAPLDRFVVGGVDLGYRSLWVLGSLAVVNALLTLVFFKELKLSTFDPALAAALGFAPAVIHYGLMAVVSVTTVVAFDSVGAILVVAMLVVPAATALMLTDHLPRMLLIACGVAAVAAVGGYGLARAVDGSIAGSVATVNGIVFLAASLLAPRHGVLARMRRHRRLEGRLALRLLLDHLAAPGAARPDDIGRRLLWSPAKTSRTVKSARRERLVEPSGDGLVLSDRGRRWLAEAWGA